MNIKQEIRKALKNLAGKCGYEDFVVLSGKKYYVGCMSYDEYFIEPFQKGKTERDPFHKNTIWEKSDFAEVLQLLVDNGYFELSTFEDKKD